MRFGRRSKAKPISVRREVADHPEAVLGPVATEERNALLSYDSISEPAPVLRERVAAGGADPTQQLGTALGRFHRYVMKGAAGAPQDYWSDDCMNQLAAAIEVALSQSWMHLVESLTDVARILQSYENAGRANQCVPFLTESYELLSLMVGDLMVNNPGSGVVERWRERYKRAAEELTAAGLMLVQDDLEEDLGPRVPNERTPEIIPFERPRDEQPSSEETLDSAPTLDSFLPFLDVREADEAAEDGLAPDETFTLAAEATEPPATVAPKDDAPERAVRAEAAETTALLDALCEDFSVLEHSPEAQRASCLPMIIERVSALASHAEARQQELPQQVCARMIKLCTAAGQRDGSLLDRFLDTAYGFCEAYVESVKEPDSEAAKTWLSDAESLVSAFVESASAAEPDADTGENASPESLLETAKRAVASGDVNGAKSLALQAVAHIARAEAGKAEARVREAEMRLRESTEAIDRGRTGVKKTEQEVLVAESRVTEGEAELGGARGCVTKATESVGSIERRISELDEQMRLLIAARNAEDTKIREANAELDREREAEIQAEAELRSLQEAEELARMRLENGRQQVKDLQRRRSELDEALARSREALTRHRASLSDIERTAAQLHTAESPAPREQQEELLF